MIDYNKKMGSICILCGIAIIFTRVIVWVFTRDMMPNSWGGQLLITVGASLLGGGMFLNRNK